MKTDPPFWDETFVRGWEHHVEADSTNDIALGRIVKASELPYLVIADRQRRGRGRGSNRWWGGEGALTFSLILATHRGKRPAVRPQASLVVGCAICDALRSELSDADVRVKWPNDVYVDGRKVCGVLLESHPGESHRYVVGIGLNVNNSMSAAPEELRSTAVSLVDISPRPWQPADVLIAVLQSLERFWSGWEAGSLQLHKLWPGYCYLSGRKIAVASASGMEYGTCRGIAEDGALLLETQGQMRKVYAGTIAVL